MTQTMYGDASGRGAVSGYRVSIPARQHPYTEEEIAAVVNVMRNVDGQTQGTYLAKFQEDFAAFTGAKHAFAVDNATNALSLAATLCGIRPGDEVIIPAYTFCASAIPFGKAGAKNAAILAAQMIALSDEGLAAKLQQFKDDMAREVMAKDEKIRAQFA